MEGPWWEIPGNQDPPTAAVDSGELQALGIGNTSESRGSRRQIAQNINKWENPAKAWISGAGWTLPMHSSH